MLATGEVHAMTLEVEGPYGGVAVRVARPVEMGVKVISACPWALVFASPFDGVKYPGKLVLKIMGSPARGVPLSLFRWALRFIWLFSPTEISVGLAAISNWVLEGLFILKEPFRTGCQSSSFFEAFSS